MILARKEKAVDKHTMTLFNGVPIICDQNRCNHKKQNKINIGINRIETVYYSINRISDRQFVLFIILS